MKGQISLEYLMLTLIALVLISFSLNALLKIKDAAEASHEMLLFNSSVNDVYNAAQELCAMGSNNVLTVTLGTALSASSSGKTATFTHSTLTPIERRLTCELGDFKELSGEIEMTNKEGKITSGPV